MTEKPSNSSNTELEPTIVPIRRPVTLGAPKRVESSRTSGVVTAVAVALAAVAVAVVFLYLPSRGERTQSPVEPEPAPVVETATVAAETPLSDEERAVLRARAEVLLSELLEQRQDLDARSATSWGDESWTSYETAARLADEAFLAENFREAVRQYEEALATGTALLQRSADIVSEALAAGFAAIDSGQAELAASQFAVVLGIEPDNAEALRGQRRATALPDVLAAMRRGDAADEAGDLEQAAVAYREALALDSDWTAARTALESVNARSASARLDRLLDEAYAALDAGEYEHAAAIFNEALLVRADSTEARDGLAKAEQGQIVDAIAVAEVRGRASERTERWDQAIARYEEALAADPSLSFALEGRARSQARADLEAKLQVLIDTPRLLLTEEVLADGQRLLDEARAIAEPGPQHRAQVERLAMLIDLAATPIPIMLASDGQTLVSVYRVGDLGSFTEMELSLKPGDYIAVGRRQGFRDVRENFSVLPGVARDPVRVVCTEPI